MIDQVAHSLAAIVTSLVSVPAVQGLAVAAVTEVVKKAPVGPSQGPWIRIVAALLAVSASVASAASQGDITQIDSELVSKHLLEALSAFLAAVGAWQLTKKK